MENYYKIGYTIVNGSRYEVYENEENGNDVDWLLVGNNKKLYRSFLDVILL